MNPTTKTMAAGGLSAALVTIIVTEAARWGVTISGDEAAAFGIILATALHYAARWLPAEAAENPSTPEPEKTP